MPDLQTSRLRVHYLEHQPAGGDSDTPRVMLVHGNVSSSLFFRQLLERLPVEWHTVAPDLRGFGETEAHPIDATRGLLDWSDDLWAFVDALGWTDCPFHLLGWSMGGGVAMQMALDASERLASLTLVSPLSPYGFGGTVDTDGTPMSPDFAGSGGGTVNPIFVQRIKEGDRGSEDANSPRNVLRAFYVHPGFYPGPELEDEWVTSMLSTRTGDDYYPGDFTPTSDWPGVAPGTRGVANAMSPEFVHLAGLAEIDPQPPILWVRGARDLIVSDRSMFDLAVLGEMGLVPDWPGPVVAPPQPMVTQMRAVLDAYAAAGGTYQEIVYEGSAHSPHLEEPDRFRDDFVNLVSSTIPTGSV